MPGHLYAGRQGQQQIQQRLGVPSAPPPNAMTPARMRAAFEGLDARATIAAFARVP